MCAYEAEYYRALYEVARTINSSLDLSEVLQRVAKSTAEALKVKACSIRLLSNDRKRLLYGAGYGLSDTYLRKGAIEVAKSGVDRQVLRGNSILIPDAAADARFQYPERARQVANRIRAGRVYINAAPFDRSLPFGGYKQSGNGREFGVYGFREYLEVKAILGHSA